MAQLALKTHKNALRQKICVTFILRIHSCQFDQVRDSRVGEERRRHPEFSLLGRDRQTRRAVDQPPAGDGHHAEEQRQERQSRNLEHRDRLQARPKLHQGEGKTVLQSG